MKNRFRNPNSDFTHRMQSHFCILKYRVIFPNSPHMRRFTCNSSSSPTDSSASKTAVASPTRAACFFPPQRSKSSFHSEPFDSSLSISCFLYKWSVHTYKFVERVAPSKAIHRPACSNSPCTISFQILPNPLIVRFMLSLSTGKAGGFLHKSKPPVELVVCTSPRRSYYRLTSQEILKTAICITCASAANAVISLERFALCWKRKLFPLIGRAGGLFSRKLQKEPTS